MQSHNGIQQQEEQKTITLISLLRVMNYLCVCGMRKTRIIVHYKHHTDRKVSAIINASAMCCLQVSGTHAQRNIHNKYLCTFCVCARALVFVSERDVCAECYSRATCNQSYDILCKCFGMHFSTLDGWLALAQANWLLLWCTHAHTADRGSV